VGPHPGRRSILILKSVVRAPPVAPPPPSKSAPRLVEIAIAARNAPKLAREAALKWLSRTYPDALSPEVRPLAIRVGRLRWPEAKAAGVKRAGLNAALKFRTNSFRYLDALINDAVRFDLDRNATEPVSAEHRQRAREMKAKLERIQRERAQAKVRKDARS
jgi:sRNA-binding protein